MKNLFLLICMTFVIQACTNDEQSPANFDSSIAFSLKDSEGNDLLNPVHPNYYHKDSIKIYTTEGVLINYAIGVNDDSYIVPNSYIYYIGQMCNDEEFDNMYCKRYWHWNSTEVDTIEVFLKRYDESLITTYKYKINGVVYEGENINGKIIQLVK